MRNRSGYFEWSTTTFGGARVTPISAAVAISTPIAEFIPLEQPLRPLAKRVGIWRAIRLSWFRNYTANTVNLNKCEHLNECEHKSVHRADIDSQQTWENAEGQ